MEYRLKAYYREGEKPSALRRAGKLPGVMYNRHLNRKVYVDLVEFDKVFRQASIHHVIVLELPDGQSLPTLVRQVNLDKRRRRPEHVDFFVLSAEPVEMYVPLRLVGTPDRITDLFAIAGLDGVFERYATTEEASRGLQ